MGDCAADFAELAVALAVSAVGLTSREPVHELVCFLGGQRPRSLLTCSFCFSLLLSRQSLSQCALLKTLLRMLEKATLSTVDAQSAEVSQAVNFVRLHPNELLGVVQSLRQISVFFLVILAWFVPLHELVDLVELLLSLLELGLSMPKCVRHVLIYLVFKAEQCVLLSTDGLVLDLACLPQLLLLDLKLPHRCLPLLIVPILADKGGSSLVLTFRVHPCNPNLVALGHFLFFF